jgi:putative acetyltransferase
VQVFVRESTSADFDAVLYVEREAFGSSKEADLTRNLLVDASAQPFVSLLAFVENQPVGHILFTRAHLFGCSDVVVSLLAPLAVVPKFQRQGIGGCLIKRGLALQAAKGVDLVFVLGHPTYYPRYGFAPAGKFGFTAQYPIPEKDAAAWMVQALRPNVIGSVSGAIVCSDALDKPEYWRE